MMVWWMSSDLLRHAGDINATVVCGTFHGAHSSY